MYYAPYFKININDKPLKEKYVKAIAQVAITLSLDYKTNTCNFQLSNYELVNIDDMLELFNEGDLVEVSYGYHDDSENKANFLGEVNKIKINYPSTGIPTINITLLDLSCRLKKGESVGGYTNKEYSNIAEEIANNLGLKPVVSKNEIKLEKIIQKANSDFDFLKKLADEVGYEFYVDENKLFFVEQKEKSDEEISLEWRKNLNDFNPQMNTSKLVTKVEVRGHDFKTKTKIKAFSNINKKILDKLGKKGKTQLELGSGGKSVLIKENMVFNSFDMAQKVAKSMMSSIESQFITGTGTCVGMPNLKPGVDLNIKGLGKKFSGDYYVTKTTHTIGTNGYTTSFDVNMRFEK